MSIIREYFNFYYGVIIFLRGSFHFILTRNIQKQDQIIQTYFSKMQKLWKLTIEVSGQEYVDPSESYVIVGNHQSLMDIPVVYASVPVSIRMAAKAELFKIPVFGYVIRHGNFIPIERNNSRKAISSLTKANELFQNNISLFMSPEGTRSKDGKLLPFKKGPFVLAIEHKKKILPVVIQNTRHVVVKGSLRIKSNQIVQVKILPAVDASELTYQDRDRLTKKVEALFKNEMG